MQLFGGSCLALSVQNISHISKTSDKSMIKVTHNTIMAHNHKVHDIKFMFNLLNILSWRWPSFVMHVYRSFIMFRTIWQFISIVTSAISWHMAVLSSFIIFISVCGRHLSDDPKQKCCKRKSWVNMQATECHHASALERVLLKPQHTSKI